MNQGILLLDSDFFSKEAIDRLAANIKASQDWNPIHASGEYATDQWKQVVLISGGKPTSELSNFPKLRQIQDWCKTDIDKMVFYALAPGAKLHPHRNLSGTCEFGKLYFHLPIITDPKCMFYVSLLLGKAIQSVFVEPQRLAGRFRSLKQLVQQKLSHARKRG